MSPSFRYKRNETIVTVTTAGVQLVGPNLRRKKMIISAPALDVNGGVNVTKVAAQASTAAAGTALTFTVPSNIQATLFGATAGNFVGGGPTVALQLVRGAATVELARGTAQINFNVQVPLLAGDVIRWQTIAGIAATTVDFTLGLQLDQHAQRITLSTQSPPVLDSGLNIYPGWPPQYIDNDIMGSAFSDNVFAISANGSPILQVIDIFD